MALNGVNCADMLLRIYSLTLMFCMAGCYTDEVSHDILIYWQQKADVWQQLSSVACGLLGVPATSLPPPQDGTVSVIVLFTIVFGCVTDCNCNLYYCKVPL